jgi:hypothetical protein
MFMHSVNKSGAFVRIVNLTSANGGSDVRFIFNSDFYVDGMYDTWLAG